MFSINLKAITSAFAALALTAVLSWAFVTGTNLELAQRGHNAGFVVAISALVR